MGKEPDLEFNDASSLGIDRYRDFIRSDYIRRKTVDYCCRGVNAILAQGDVYRVAASIASWCVIDFGCGHAEKTVRYFEGRKIVGIDHGANIEFCRQEYPRHTWMELDFENTTLDVSELPFEHSVVVCADVIEHLVNPQPLINALRVAAGLARAVVISTPERELIHGVNHHGPPLNPCHAREWNILEFQRMLVANEIPAEVGLCRATDACSHPKNIIAVVRAND